LAYCGSPPRFSRRSNPPEEAKFCTDHIEKAIFVTLASIFSETVGGMKLKFGEEIEKKNSSIKICCHSGEIFSIFALIPV